jgi:GTP cyclohydrolase-4
MTLKCDLQYGRGDVSYKLTRVGVKGVRKPVLIKRDGASPLNNVINCSVDIFVDLPASQKGSHMSRNVEVLNEVVEESVVKPVSGLEDMAADMCNRLLVHHEYAQTADVTINAEYFRNSQTPQGRQSLEMFRLIAGGHIERGVGLTKKIGVQVIGMTACPCAQQTVREMLEFEGEMPVMSHNQRNVVTLTVTIPEEYSIEADELIDVVQGAFSSPTFGLLKRPDEGSVVINAHTNTKFVEDTVRSVLQRFVERFTDLPDCVEIDVISDSEESIHKHDAYAQRVATLGELRQENQ